MTPKNDRNFEINGRLILVMRSIGKRHSVAEKFLHLMNHWLYTIVIWDCTQKKLQAVMDGNFTKVKLQKSNKQIEIALARDGSNHQSKDW